MSSPISKYVIPYDPAYTDIQRDHFGMRIVNAIMTYAHGVIAIVIPFTKNVDGEPIPVAALLVCADGELDTLFNKGGVSFLHLSQLSEDYY